MTADFKWLSLIVVAFALAGCGEHATRAASGFSPSVTNSSSPTKRVSARAISGGPVYVSDKPGSHDFDLLRKLVLPDGKGLDRNVQRFPAAAQLGRRPGQILRWHIGAQMRRI